MSSVCETVSGISVAVGTVDQPEDLSAIHRPDCAAVIWRRRLLPSFQAWIDGLSPDKLPEARIVLRPTSIAEAVGQVCEAARVTGSPECARFIDDIAALGAIFERLMAAPYLRLRLDVVKTNACRKFHLDNVSARLVCTYRGVGTQYGTSAGGGEPERVFTVPTGSPMILRGTQWPTHPPSGVLHRSPPIEGTGETRLLLVLDPLTDPEDS